MALQDAINFIKDAGQIDDLRHSLIPLKQSEILPSLERQGYKFNLTEFEEAINVMHVQCKTEEDANFLFEVINWFKLLHL